MSESKQTFGTPEALIAHAAEIPSSAPAGTVFGLIGDLGAGKTQFTKGIATGLGVDPSDVTSPTFTLINEYLGGRLPLFHFDFYRLASAEEALAIGWDEYAESEGILAVEWADKFPDLLPPETIRLHFEILPDGARQITEKPL